MSLDRLVRRWLRGQRLAIGLRGLGVALAAGALTWVLMPEGAGRWMIVGAVAMISAMASIWLPRPPMANRDLVASHLDRIAPELEDSTDLLIREPAHPTGLEMLQKNRVREALARSSHLAAWPRTQLRKALRVLLGGVVVAVLVLVGQFKGLDPRSLSTTAGGHDSGFALDSAHPFERVRVEIEPPGYTREPAVQQESLDIDAMEGSRIRWQLPRQSVRAALVLATGDRHEFRPREDGVELELAAEQSDVYQLVVGEGEGQDRSRYARISVTPDATPRLAIVEPVERVTLVGRSEGSLDLTIEAEDDHGLQDIDLVVTLAQGSGELVEFRQHRLPVRPGPTGRRDALLSRLDLSQLGLEAGSELYFFAEARDNREPEPNIGRSATHIVRFPAERLPSAELAEGLPIVLPPEYFRSQRQIILDTEKLIAEELELSRDQFQRRAEGLGFDQRALRMRYGTLLGEEFESGRPVGAGEIESGGGEDDHEHETAGQEPEQLEGVPSGLVHFHDSAEISTYFTSDVRTQLKRVLAQMWDAEGRLRIHRPREALPFEYAALDLLKDLQNRSRIYVQKVGFETPPLEPENLRLSGDLEDIQTRVEEVQATAEEPLTVAARSVLAVLQQEPVETHGLEEEAMVQIRTAVVELAVRESKHLLALAALDRLALGDLLGDDERESLEQALWLLVPDPVQRPNRERSTTDPLAEMYRSALSEGVKP